MRGNVRAQGSVESGVGGGGSRGRFNMRTGRGAARTRSRGREAVMCREAGMPWRSRASRRQGGPALRSSSPPPYTLAAICLKSSSTRIRLAPPGGIGRELAAWMADGSTSIDLFSYDVARFHSDTVRDARWVKDRTHESYAKTYSIVFPHDEPLAGRGARRSALHEVLAARGCVYQARHGYERPGRCRHCWRRLRRSARCTCTVRCTVSA